MHPAPSVIIFTTFSGLGFGMLFWLGIGVHTPTGFTAFAYFTVAYLMAVGGLLASTFHLGHPERALKAFTQWRSSWLSREGIAAVAALIVMALYGAGLVFAATPFPLVGIIGAILAALTVFTTSMIYTQLKTVPRWNQWPTPALFMSLSLGGGALFVGQVTLAFLLLLIAAVIQGIHWVAGDSRLADSGTTLGTATGLGTMGRVKAFEPPHTGTNYLLREFVHEVGRKHAFKLRVIAFGLGYALPLLLLALPYSFLLAALAAIAHVAGILASRWLFFAEAEHVVGLYYGKR
ncbi:dimethyl sulfoxide reductase anchor subunit family protein [Pontivivens insulae]|uniref:DMSO reductase anchor subunit (DmsC) n=1 Tax=Pontivivens insulae TaxID=1639689 RepID=A0A2R8A8X3_9RHOB|nr:DmsC/YnfH family molybdoenzyme membrane anchor subunit [Pontivivens insulae]RED18775.1 DMSO reductase anchor subunit [Pontivivens insulae]SPF28673.1 hypothetical protein POI8812_00976 [Pontivivens insulae]